MQRTLPHGASWVEILYLPDDLLSEPEVVDFLLRAMPLHSPLQTEDFETLQA